MSDRYLLDANVLIALHDARHIHHAPARRWMADVESWATTPVTETAFVRLLSNPVVMGESVTPAEALRSLRDIKTAPGCTFLRDASTLDDPMIDLSAMLGHRMITDFHLVNLAARTESVFATFDAKIAVALAPADRVHLHVIGI